jgi:uncharacterized protein (DUF1330 family)
MPAYLVYVCHGVSDREAMEEYWPVTQVTFEGRHMQVHAAYTPFAVLEGDDEVYGVVIAEFPIYEACRAWYDGRGYVSARQHRLRGASYLGILVDGGYDPAKERMLVQGASGGVPSALIQLGVAVGMRVWAAGRTPQRASSRNVSEPTGPSRWASDRRGGRGSTAIKLVFAAHTWGPAMGCAT